MKFTPYFVQVLCRCSILLALIGCSQIVAKNESTTNTDVAANGNADTSVSVSVDNTRPSEGFAGRWGRIDNAPEQNKGNLGKKDASKYFLYGAEDLNLENYYFDIPVAYNDAVKKWIHYFRNKGRDFFERYAARAGRYAPLMGKILEDNGLPGDLIFLAMAESGFQDNAKSWAQAVGPWQFMSYTGKKYGLDINWYIDERRDPIKSTIGAAKYLKKLYEEFGSWEIAASAYNAGEGKMGRAIRKYNSDNFWNLRQKRFLRSETKNYVPKIMALAIIGKNLKSFGFDSIAFHEPLDFDEIDVPGDTDLIALSARIGVDFEEIQRLNPEILRWYIPQQIDNYKLRIPTNMNLVWNTQMYREELRASKSFRPYVVTSKMTLKSLAKKFRLQPTVLQELNRMAQNQTLPKGTTLVLPFRNGQSERDPMYNDLYEKPRRYVLYKRRYHSSISHAIQKGSRIKNPQAYYVVQKGDNLWTVAKKTGTPINTLIASNLGIIKNRMIRAGDRLIIR